VARFLARRTLPARLAAAAVVWLVSAAAPQPAQADLYFAPYAALKFGGETTLLDPDFVAGSNVDAEAAKKMTWGGSVMWLGTGVLGFEGDFAVVPAYFQADPPVLVTASRVTTLTANVVIAAPLSVTGYSLRPYVSGGWGLMRASADSPLGSYTRNLAAIDVGGGAIGMLSRRSGVRWDLRYLRGIGSEEGGGTLRGAARLTFWRASMAFVLRY
jgi:hypothetical protein